MLKTIKRIVCPVDLYDFQPEAAEYAMTLANALDAKIIVLYVIEPLPLHFYSEGAAIPPSFAEEEAAKRRAESKMKEVLSEFFNSSVDNSEVALGQAADEIIQIAEKSSADMIIMASHGRSGLERIIYGSVTNKVLVNAKIPVLVVQPSKEQ